MSEEINLSSDTLNEARKESEKVVSAFLSKKAAKGARSHSDGSALYLHGNKIAWHGENGAIHATHAGWGTTTTKERLNTLADKVGSKRFHTKKGQLYHGDRAISDTDVVKLREGHEMDEETIDEAGVENLKPGGGQVDSAPQTKLEYIAKIVGAATQADTQWVKKWFDGIEKDLSAEAPDNSDANKATNDLKGGGQRIAPQPLIKIKEDVEALFEGEELTETAKEKMTTLFEAAVNARVGIERIALQEAYEEALTEEVEAFITEEKKTLAQYIDHAVENWISENQVAVVDSLRLDIAEEFMGRVRDAFIETRIDLPEEKIDILADMQERLADLEEKQEALVAENLELQALIEGKSKEDVIASVSEGLTLMDREKLKTLTETIEADSTEEFERKVKIIKEKHFAPAKKSTQDVLSLNEQVPGSAAKIEDVDPSVAALAARMRFSL